jgi:hypothetical protein
MGKKPEAYDTAQVCINGHEVNPSYHDYPKHNAEFCKICGAKTIISCPKCNAEIDGYYRDSMGLSRYKAPAFCPRCGQPFPWTESRLRAASELTDLATGVTQDEKDRLVGDLPDLVASTPQTPVAVARMKIFLAKAGKEISSGLRDLFVDVMSEAIKKQIWGP